MTKKKNGFWTFLFSLIPGAAEMYMGFMKMGVSLMTVFMLVFMLAIVADQGILVMVNVILWFYSFFHAHNLSGLEDEDFYAYEDHWLFIKGDEDLTIQLDSLSKYRKLAGGVLIVLGISMIWDNVIDFLENILPSFLQDLLYNIGYYVPQFVLAICIILAGIYMIRGKKKALDKEDNAENNTEEDADEAAENRA